LRINFRHAAPSVVLEYKNEGKVEDKKDWILYKDWSSRQLLAMPHRQEEG